mgnify:CR=1 FL=1
MLPRYRRHPLTAGRIVDGLAFVITADDNKLHTLNAAATHLWRIAQDGCDANDAAAELARVYEVDDATALRDATRCLEDLVTRQILVSEGVGRGRAPT